MSQSKKISVMISSRCKDQIIFENKTQEISNVRSKLKQELESIKLFDKDLFEVWINEDAPPEEGSQDSWEHCMTQVSQANIVLVLYNGNSGWAKEDGDVGICHAELQTALSHAPAKVRLIQIESKPNIEDNDRNKRFKEYIEKQNLFRGEIAKNGEEVIQRCKEALKDAVVDMVNLGVLEARKGKFYTGAALEWSKLDFQKRKKTMENTLLSNLKSRKSSTEKENIGVFVQLKENNKLILFKCHAVPDSMSVSAAREMVGQPFLNNYKYDEYLRDNYVGLVHLIACYSRVTEEQVRKLIGSPDVIILSPPFGIYAVDHIHKSQLILITNCRDDTSTRNGLQRFFDWLEQSGESDNFLKRAIARTQIIKAIAQANKETILK